VRKLSIEKVINQSFSFTLDGNDWRVTLSAGQTSTLVSITINNNLVVSAIRAVSGTPVLFNTTLGALGNLLFLCGDDVVPDPSKFGESHFLYYLSPGELG